MSVPQFLKNPKHYKLKLDEKTYAIIRKLAESGDPQSFASYLLQAQSEPFDYLVIKLPVLYPEGNKGLPDSGAVDGTEEKRLQDAENSISAKKKEAEYLARVTASGRFEPVVPNIHSPAAFCISNEAPQTDISKYIIVRDFIKGLLLSDWMIAYEKTQPCPAKCFAGIRDIGEWFQLARKLVTALEPIHRERLVHGDLRPRNIILENLDLGDLTVSDDLVGLNPERLKINKATVRLLDAEEDAPESFPPAGIKATGTFRRRYDSPERLFTKKKEDDPFEARKSSAQWFAPTDIFSLGIILFRLACGDDVHLGPFLDETLVKESVLPDANCPTWFRIASYQTQKTNRQLKADLLEMWERSQNSRLAEPRNEITKAQLAKGKEAAIRMSEVILGCLRSRTDPAVSDLKAIEAIIDEFEPAPERNCAETISSQSVEVPADCDYLPLKNALHNFLKQKASRLPQAVKDLIVRRGERLIGPLDGLMTSEQRWFLPITGRAAMVDNMVSLIGHLSPNDSCCALLTPNFFFRENMGLIGRLTSSLQLAAIRGVDIKWILVVNGEHWKDRDVAEVLQHQKSAANFLSGLDVSRVKPYGINFVVVEKPEYDEFFRKRLTAIHLISGNGKDKVLVAPDYHGEDGRMCALRIWPRPDDDRWKEFDIAFDCYKSSKLHVTAFHR